MINLRPRIARSGFPGALALLALVAILPAQASAQSLTSAVVHPATVVNGTPSVGTVTLSAAAPAGGTVVLLSSSSPAAVTLPVVTVPQGATSAHFVVDTVAVAVSTPVRIDATYNGVTFSPTLTVTPRVPVRGVSGDLWADVVIGQPDFTQTTMHEVTPTRLFSPGGILVDRSVRPNRVYLYDGGNNRVLGLSHLGTCGGGPNVGLNCTTDSDCPNSACAIQEGLGADLVLGQPSLTTSACNGDSGYQRYPTRAPASASSLCSTPEISGNMEERAGWANLALDSAGNVYVPDFDNHRVLRYNSPFTTNAVADYVWGQANFTDNTCNRGRTGPVPEAGPPLGDAESLCLRSLLNKGFTAGVDIDPLGNLWVADNTNHRVLRFPKDPVTGIPRRVADLVLGQPDFTTAQPGIGLNQMCAPAAVRVDASGTVYVADSQKFCGLGSDGRVLVFSPPLTNGMSASGTLGSGLRHPSGLTLDPAGGLWVTDTDNSQFLLFNGGSVQKVLGKACPDYTGSFAGNPSEDGPFLCYDDGYCVESSILFQAKGSIGIDGDGNVFLAANVVHDMWRFPAPIPSLSTTCPSEPATPVAHSADKRIFRPRQYGLGNHVGAHGFRQPPGLAVTTDQLILAEQGRLLFWNGPATLTSGKAADGYIEQGQFTGFDFEGIEPYGRITVDKMLPTPHLWALGFPNHANGAQVEVFDLPLQTGATPIPGKTLTSPLNVKGGGTIDWDVLLAIGGIAAAPDGGKIWLADPVRHRVFRVSDPLTSPMVDIVLGQAGVDPALDTQCNRGNSLPSQTSLCRPGAVTLDPLGNVYVSDGSLEAEGNLRLLEFDASVFPVNPPVALFGLPATRVFGRNGDFTEPLDVNHLHSNLYNKYIAQAQTQPAFTSGGQMVVGSLGELNFPVIYQTPLLRDEVDGYLNDFTAYGGYSAVFDSNDDLYMVDLDHANVFIYRHPSLPAPDLIVSALTAPATGGAGLAITVTSTTKNQTGAIPAPASTTKFYLSTNSTWDAGDTFLGSRTIPTLAPGAVSSGSTTLTIPPGTAAGSYYVIAKADADNLIFETIETNNTASDAIAIGPDLIVSALTVPASAVAGSAFNLTDTTKNQTGTSPAPASTTRFYLSTNTTWEAGDAQIGSRGIPTLNPGASNSGSASVTIPAGTATGNYYIIAKADGDGSLFETNETNNTKYASIRVSPPDLIISAISAPATGGAGLTITASNTTKNQTNTGPAPASTTRFYLSVNATLHTGDPVIGFQPIGILAPGASEAHSTTLLTIPGTTSPGTYYVIAKADADGLIPETLETNNTASDTIVIGPDLIVSALTVPATGGAGLPISVTSTTKNQGGGSAAASTTKFYLSTNNTYGSGDILLGERAIGTLIPGATSAGPSALTIPTGTAAGTYYILALADDPNVNPETIETNNTTAALIKISPDLIVSVLGAPTSAAAGVPFTVTDTTKNQGQGIATPTTTKFYLSSNATWDDGDTEIGARPVGQLAYGATSSGSTSVTIPTSGTWYILAKADATGAVAEASETNNVISKVITITP